MSFAPRSALLTRATAAAVVGTALALTDAAVYAGRQEALANPFAFVTGLSILCVLYALLSLPAALVLTWRTMVGSAAVAAGAVHWLARTYSHHPSMEASGALAALAAGSAVGAAIAFVCLRLLPRPPRSSRPIVLVTAVIGTLAIVGLARQAVLSAAPDPAQAARPPGAGYSGAADRAAGKPNLLVFTFDTLRADRLGVAGYRRIATPNLDGLAREGVLFTNTIAQAPMTPPSHASIFTGMLPAAHGIRAFEGRNHLREGIPTLAEVLSREGYRTAAIIAASPLTPGSGLERGFDEYVFSLPPLRYPFLGLRKTLMAKVLMRTQLVRDRDAYWNAETQTDRALRWLEGGVPEPFFLWVHYFDAHDPYAPPRGFLRPEVHPGSSWKNLLERTYLYDSDVAYLDSQVGRLVDHLRQSGRLDRTVLVGISDHGEGLGEHDYVGHSERVYGEQLRIPFFIRYPRRIPPASRVAAQVRSIDLFPTVLEILKVAPPQGRRDGESLMELVDRPDRGHDRIAVSETLQNPARSLIAVSDGRTKLIFNISDRSEQWFDLRSDPGETRNLAGNAPPEAESLRRLAAAYTERSSVDEGTSTELDPAVRQRLRALGYLE